MGKPVRYMGMEGEIVEELPSTGEVRVRLTESGWTLRTATGNMESLEDTTGQKSMPQGRDKSRQPSASK